MSTRFHWARLHSVLLLGLPLTLACAPGKTTSVTGDATEEKTTAAVSDRTTGQPPQKSELLIRLPQGCNTPDGMALLPDGSFVLSVPNFNDLREGACLMRVQRRQPGREIHRLAGTSGDGPAGRATGHLPGTLWRSVPGRLPEHRRAAVPRVEDRDERRSTGGNPARDHRFSRLQRRDLP